MSLQGARITVFHFPTMEHGEIRPHRSLVVPHRCAKDFQIFWGVFLGEGGHHAAHGGLGHPQADGTPNADNAPDPLVFDEALHFRWRFQNQIGAETPDRKTAAGIEAFQMAQSGCRQEVKNRHIKECRGEHGLGRDFFRPAERFQVRVELLQHRLPGRLVLQGDLAAQGGSQEIVESGLVLENSLPSGSVITTAFGGPSVSLAR